MFWLQSVVLAQVTSTPSSSGLPGAHLIQEMINWLAQIALWGSLASILLGAAIYGLSQQSGNYAGGYRGKQLALAGVVGACLAGVGRPRSTCCSGQRTDDGEAK
jgi:hypothetical protein